MRELRIIRRGGAEFPPFAMLGGDRFLCPCGGGGFSLDADAVERRSGGAGTLEGLLRAAQDR